MIARNLLFKFPMFPTHILVSLFHRHGILPLHFTQVVFLPYIAGNRYEETLEIVVTG